MTLPHNFIPQLPFPNFKWKWASLQCTEGINDPVVLLGVLFRMRNLEEQNRGLRYSSPEFAEQMKALSCNAPRLSRAALRRSSQKMRISFSDRLLRRPILSYAAEALNHLSYS